MKFLLSITLFVVASGQARPQNVERIQFGKVSAADFSVSSSLIDSATGAIVIADVGSSRLETYEYGWRVVFKRIKRIRILDHNGFDACTVNIFYSAEDNRNGKLKDLRAVTYNLQNGKVEATAIPSKDFYLENSNNSDLLVEKFTFPNVSKGSVIEYSYTVYSSEISDLFPWVFQSRYPCLWSEYSTAIPHIFKYDELPQGRLSFPAKTIDSVSKEIWTGNGNIEATIFTTRWVMKDVPEIKEEPFIYCMDNYVSKINFRISRYPVNGYSSRNIIRTWQSTANRLSYNVHFGLEITAENVWLTAPVEKIDSGCASSMEKAKRLFGFVRDSFRCTGEDAYLHSNLPWIFNHREGGSGELNLLLITMLRKANISADPVILATRDNGFTDVDYPIMDNINYTVCGTLIDNKIYYLDASVKNLGFGKLPIKCYNGQARVISSSCFPVFLDADSLMETSATELSLINDKKGGMLAAFTKRAGYYESLDLRNQLKEEKPGTYLANIPKTFSIPVEWKGGSVDSVEQLEQPVTIRYGFTCNFGSENILYINPMFNQALKENPFKSEMRNYPVELPYSRDDSFVLDLEIPAGYQTGELPQSEKIVLKGENGFFEYGISATDGHIRLRCRLLVHKTIFEPEDYQDLRNFYTSVIRKENEEIVFKKK